MKKLLTILLTALMVMTIGTVNIFAEKGGNGKKPTPTPTPPVIDIDEITISNVNVTVGEKISNKGKITIEPKISADSVTYVDSEGNPENKTIKEGKNYTVKVSFKETKYLKFAEDLKATINGNQAAVERSEGNKKKDPTIVTVYYGFTTKKATAVDTYVPTDLVYDGNPIDKTAFKARLVGGEEEEINKNNYSVEFYQGEKEVEAPFEAGTYTAKFVINDEAKYEFINTGDNKKVKEVEFEIAPLKVNFVVPDVTIVEGTEITQNLFTIELDPTIPIAKTDGWEISKNVTYMWNKDEKNPNEYNVIAVDQYNTPIIFRKAESDENRTDNYEVVVNSGKLTVVSARKKAPVVELYKGDTEYVANLGSDCEMFIENLEDYKDMTGVSFGISRKLNDEWSAYEPIKLEGNNFNLKPGEYKIKVFLINDPVYDDSDAVEFTVKETEYAFVGGVAKVPYGAKEYEVVCDYDYNIVWYKSTTGRWQFEDNVRCITINGVTVDPDFYTLEKGSTIFTYKPESPMALGIYKVGFHYENGMHVEGTIIVYPEFKPTPKPTPTPYVPPKTCVK